jgi:flagellar biosynthesis anti-sigma factor FlgM
VQQLREHLDGIPDVRQERVNGLRQAISQGTFQVSPGKIADAMLAESRSLAG